MTQKLKSNFFQGLAGTSVEVLGMAGLKYKDRFRTLLIDSELLPGASGMVVYRDSIRHWEPPDDSSDITDSDREEILENLRQIFRRQGFEIDIV